MNERKMGYVILIASLLFFVTPTSVFARAIAAKPVKGQKQVPTVKKLVPNAKLRNWKNLNSKAQKKLSEFKSEPKNRVRYLNILKIIKKADAQIVQLNKSQPSSKALNLIGRRLQGSAGELDKALAAWEEKLNSLGDDAQMANVDMQNMLQKQQKTIQMLSNISKLLHETALSVIRKMK